MKPYIFTVSPTLMEYLIRLMQSSVFDNFYLAGGTSLALQLGHRVSVDIDLFTDADYGTLALSELHQELHRLFPYVDRGEELNKNQMIYTLYVGESVETEIKLDLCYDETRIFPLNIENGIRMSSLQEIAAMKIAAIVNGGRRKDFWDLHALLEYYSLNDMIAWSLRRYPYSITRDEIITSLSKVWDIEDHTEVISLRGGYWEFVADDILEAVNLIKSVE